MKDLVIREAQKNDKQDVQEIARFTWEGQDYIDKVFDQWLEDGHFFVAEIENKVIGTAKLTIFPDKVGWLEGLRVHPQYRGQGIGRKLQDFTREYGIALIRKGVINCLEFSTYYKNQRTIQMALKDGFYLTKRFYILVRNKTPEMEKPTLTKIYMEDLTEFKEYLSMGWRFLHKTQEALQWMLGHITPFRISTYKFYQYRTTSTFTLLHFSKEAIESYIKALNWISEKAGFRSYEIILPEESTDFIHIFKQYNFSFWDKPEEANIYVFKYALKHYG